MIKHFSVRKRSILIVTFFVCLFIIYLAFLVFPATSLAQPYVYVTKWGSTGTGDGQFDQPVGVAADSTGNVYVADTNNDRIQKFNSTGTFLTKWGTFGVGDGQFNEPNGIGIDSSNNLYVADINNNRVQKFTSASVFMTKWGSFGAGDGQFNLPGGVAVDSSNNVYVTDFSNNRIQKFTSAGAFITKWGSAGGGDGQFSGPIGIGTDPSSNVYVADFNNNRVQKFTSTGTFITKWGSAGAGDGQFGRPSGIAVDASSNVYVADSDNDRIQKFNSTGTFIAKWGSFGTGNGQFDRPWRLWVDSLGRIVYVADRNNDRIQKFSNDTTPPTTTLTTSPVAPDGNNGWFKTNPTITLTPNEPATTYYDWSITPPTTVYTVPFNMAAQGTYTLYYRSNDGINVEPVKSQAFKYDSTAPIDPSAFSSPTHSVNVWSSVNVIKVDWPAVGSPGGASDSISGVDGFSDLWSQNAPQTPNSSKCLEEGVTSVSSGPLADGAWYFNLRTEDNAGNWTTTASYGPFLISRGRFSDHIIINSGGIYTKSRSVTLNLSAAADINEMRFSNDAINWSAWEGYCVKKNWTLSSGNGTRTVWVQFKDYSGDTRTYSDSIILDTYKPRTYAVRSSAWRATTKRATHYKSLYTKQKAKARSTGNLRKRKIFLSLANKYYQRYRYCLKQMANAPLFWKVKDNTDDVYVKLKIKKRTYSRSRAQRKQRYWDLYKLVKAKALRIKNRRMRRRYLNQARIYKRRYRSIKSTYYRHVKTATYGWTSVNLERRYTWRTKTRGTYRFYVLAKDRAGNSQRNVARNYLIVR